MKRLEQLNKKDVKELMNQIKKDDEKILDIQLNVETIWILVKNECNVMYNYSIHTDGYVSKYLVNRFASESWHYCDVELGGE